MERAMQRSAESIEKFVTATIAELAHCRQDQVAREMSLVELGIDSLVVATLVSFVEAQYECSLTLEQATALFSAVSVEDVVLTVSRTLNQRTAGN